MSKTVLILGATSDIGKALAHEYAHHSHNIILAGRKRENLVRIANDIQVRYKVMVYSSEFDAVKFEDHHQFYNSLQVFPDVVISVFGFMGNQPPSELIWDDISTVVDTNYKGAVSILNIAAKTMIEQNLQGTIIGISSVAGDRGRGSNLFYGSAKAGFTAYLSGLRNLLYKYNIHVMTVKPGFVYTRMTENMNLSKHLTTTPEIVAKTIYLSGLKKRNVIYILPVWEFIMIIIKLIPEAIFKKLKL